MDPEMEEIKKLLARNLALTEETNHMVHKMRRQAMWGKFWSLLWWVLIFAVSYYSYVVYLQPYMDKAMELYNQVQTTQQQASDLQKQVSTQASGWQQQASDLLKSYLPK